MNFVFVLIFAFFKFCQAAAASFVEPIVLDDIETVSFKPIAQNNRLDDVLEHEEDRIPVEGVLEADRLFSTHVAGLPAPDPRASTFPLNSELFSFHSYAVTAICSAPDTTIVKPVPQRNFSTNRIATHSI